MQTEAYRELKVLEELSANPSLTQRTLSNRLEVALGLTNLMVRRLIKKGFVKVVSTQRNRIRYFLTPTGIAEKTRLTYEYLEYSLHLYREVRRLLTDALSRVAASGGRRVVFFGTSEVAEITYLTIKELGLELVGVVDDQEAGTKFLGLPVTRLQDMNNLSFDCGIVSGLNGSPVTMQAQLSSLGIPEGKILVIEHQGPRLRLLPSGRG